MSINIKSEVQILIKKFDNKNFKDVINESLVILKKKDNDFLWNLVGLCFQNLNQHTRSLDCFENAIRINSKNYSAYNNLGISYKNLRKYKEAEINLLKSIQINPDYINAMVNMGNIKMKLIFLKML